MEYFDSIVGIGPSYIVETIIGSPHEAIRGVGTMRFQLEFDEFLEVDGVLFNMGLESVDSQYHP